MVAGCIASQEVAQTKYCKVQLHNQAMERRQQAVLTVMQQALEGAASVRPDGAVALVFVAGKGWICTDQVKLTHLEGDGQALSASLVGAADWFRPQLAEAVAQLHAARFYCNDEILKMFGDGRLGRPTPTVSPSGGPARDGEDRRGRFS